MFLQDVTAGNLNRFKIDTSGRVGVGNFVLTEAFQVAGNAAPSGDNSFSLGTAGLRWTDVFAVSGSVNASDRRMKENIEDTQYGLDEIMELRPVSYTWKDRPERGTKLGLIAQEVQPLISEVVHVGDDPDATLGLYYSDLVPVLIKAIQEQQDIIERQESEKVQLKSELSGTQEDVEALKTQMSELTAVIAMIKTSMAQDEQASAEGLDGAVVASASE